MVFVVFIPMLVSALFFCWHSEHLPRSLRQERIDHGELIRWTKGFGAANTEGQDVAAMFRKSLAKYVGLLQMFTIPS